MATDLAIPETARELERSAGAFSQRIAALKQMPLGLLKAAEAKDLIDVAKRYLSEVHSVFDAVVQETNAAHKRAVALRAKFLNPGVQADLAARLALSDWERERQRRLDEERRKVEAQQRAEQEAARQAEVDHLKAIGAEEEAKQVAAEPLAPPVVHIDEDKGKVDGVVTVRKFRGEVNHDIITDFEKAKVLERLRRFTDWLAAAENQAICNCDVFLLHIVMNPALQHLIEVKEGALDRWLTQNGGQALPGVKVSEDIEVRSRKPE